MKNGFLRLGRRIVHFKKGSCLVKYYPHRDYKEEFSGVTGTHLHFLRIQGEKS
jgi:hypothetical protein